jgi:D-alanyl-D-alanine carboxypeptidase (penicillin-binding protein 5/6)
MPCARGFYNRYFAAMKFLRASALCFCTFVLALQGFGQTVQSNGVRPTGIEPPPPKAQAVRPARSVSDDDDAATPKPKAKRARARATATRTADTPPKTIGGVPITGAKSVIMIDANNGHIFYEKNADETRAAASTQKLLTALIVAEHGNLDRPVMVEQVDTLAEPVKLNIKPGDSYQRIDLLRALLVKSPNDVARCLARDQAGSIEAFAAMMNDKARQLGAVHSHFVNPNGLPIPDQYSSARDLSLIAQAAYANPVIRSIVCIPKLTFRFANGRTRDLENTNKVLTKHPNCNGMKTGYTEAAGHCLICSGSRPGRDIIVVVLGDSKAGVWRDASALLSWGLSM